MIKKKYDVVIAGGGIAGTMAAIASAREGAKTLLVERYQGLGGMATLGLVQPITTWGFGDSYVIGGTGREILQDLAQKSNLAATPMSCYGPSCDPEFLKFELEKRALEQGVELLYHSWIRQVENADDGSIATLTALTKGGDLHLHGDVFVDATGDADVAALAGVPCETDSQGISLMFIVGGIDRSRCPERPGISKIYEKYKVGYRGLAIFWHPRADAAYMNVTEVEEVNALCAEGLTYATLECRRQAWEIFGILQEHVPGFEQAYIQQTAPALGVRETRRIRGSYYLSLKDIENETEFDDTVARASSPIDIHSSEEGGRGRYYGLKHSYGIPFRCMITEKVPNLIVTGRPVSADHAVHSSLRRMAPGFALGEAAGIAAALAGNAGKLHEISIAQLQDKLRSYGAILAPEYLEDSSGEFGVQ